MAPLRLRVGISGDPITTGQPRHVAVHSRRCLQLPPVIRFRDCIHEAAIFPTFPTHPILFPFSGLLTKKFVVLFLSISFCPGIFKPLLFCLVLVCGVSTLWSERNGIFILYTCCGYGRTDSKVDFEFAGVQILWVSLLEDIHIVL